MNNFERSDSRKEGDVKVDSAHPSKEKKIKKNEGDYVNYEEID
jgi:hypothetical protein